MHATLRETEYTKYPFLDSFFCQYHHKSMKTWTGVKKYTNCVPSVFCCCIFSIRQHAITIKSIMQNFKSTSLKWQQCFITCQELEICKLCVTLRPIYKYTQLKYFQFFLLFISLLKQHMAANANHLGPPSSSILDHTPIVLTVHQPPLPWPLKIIKWWIC